MRRSWLWLVLIITCLSAGVVVLDWVVGAEILDIDGPNRLTRSEERLVKIVLIQGLLKGTIYHDALGIPRRGVVLRMPSIDLHKVKRLPTLRRLREAVRVGSPSDARTAAGTILALEGEAREAWLFVSHWQAERMDEEDKSFGQSGKTWRERLLEWVDEVISTAEAEG